MSKTPAVAIRGVRMTIPTGYVLGRLGLSAGPAHLVSLKDLGDALAKAAASSQPLGVQVDVTNSGIGTGFWSDVDGSSSVWRFARRMFVGNATTQNDTRVGSTTIIPNATVGANWAVRDSQFAAGQDRGGLAVTGVTRVSDGDNVASGPASIGIAGFVICDTAGVRSGWAGYLDVQFQTGHFGYGLEMAIKNKSGVTGTASAGGTAAFESTPDFLTTGTIGIYMNTGDDSYGGAHNAPNNCAIQISSGTNGNSWNRGIIFSETALNRDVNGRGRAISLGMGHHISWYDGSNHEGFYIVSDVVTSGRGAQMIITDNVWNFQDQGGNPTFRLTNTNTGGLIANFLDIYSAIAGANIRLAAEGSDTNITLTLEPKGSGTAHVVGSLTTDTARVDTGYGYFQPTSGTTVTLSNTAYHTIIDPAAGLATLTVKMPASPVDGQVVDIRFSQAITALTIDGNGHSVAGAPTTAVLGANFTAIYKASNTTWYL